MFKDARKQAGLSREGAAFRLHIGTRTLNNYENGITTTPPDVALKMAEVYKQPTLSARYCAECCPIGQKYAHNVVEKDLAGATIGLIKELNDVKKLMDRMIEIAEDNLITEDEIPDLKKIAFELLELEHAIETMKLLVSSSIKIDKIIQQQKNKTAFPAAR